MQVTTQLPRTLIRSMPAVTKSFSTSARVYPNVHPYMNTRAPRFSGRWIPSAVAIVAAGCAATHYMQLKATSRRAAAIAAEIEEERRARESRVLAAELLEAYGDGSSLDGLEKAVQVYEAQAAARRA